MASVIEKHPQREQIIDAILAGRTLRDIAGTVTPKISIMALHRYKQGTVRPTLEGAGKLATALQSVAHSQNLSETGLDAASVTRVALAADPLLSRIAQHQKTLDGVLKTSAAGNDARGVAALIGTDLRGIELHAKLTGRLDAQPNQTNIMIVCPAGAPEPAVSLDRDAVVIDIGPKR